MSQRPGILWFVLDEESSTRLRQAVPPLYKNTFYHHVTLPYGVERNVVEAFIGKQWTVEAFAVAYNNNAQACRVQTNGLPDTYGAPHVTLSTVHGIKPFASVAMLHGEHTEATLDQRIDLTGTIEFEYLDEIRD